MINNNLKVNYGDESPIAAFATTPGNSALTLIRCSGKGSLNLISSIFEPGTIKDAEGNKVVHGWIVNKKQKIDEVLVSVFRAPKSYTGEDSFDISCHGGAAAGKAVMNAVKTAGFRDALPGEFTFRAFMNGKLDLTRSESVMELVSARTDSGRSRAISRLSGSLEKEINEIKNMLVQVLAAAEIYLDYSEDEISAEYDTTALDEIAGRLPERNTALTVLERLDKLAASWKFERIYQEGIVVVIAGCPNAGKSSLFNLLLKEDRSIVTEIPGTTRDWIEAHVSIEGIPIRLIDTAGLRDTLDTVEKIGVERSRKLLEEADIVIYLFDGSLGVTDEDRAELKLIGRGSGEKVKTSVLFLWNKSDITLPPKFFPIENITPICISAKTGDGFSQLYSSIMSSLQLKNECLTISLGTERQKILVDAAYSALDEALSLAEREEPLELIAPLLRQAVNSLGEITGEVSTADILEEMFSRFCVGK
jgi:tRNA modification GTPase